MKQIVSAAAAAFLLLAPAVAFAQDSNANKNANEKTDCGGRLNDAFDSLPEKCKAELQTWTMGQADSNMDVEGDFAVGAVVPDSVTLIDVPDSDNYSIAMINKKRMLVNRKDRHVIHVY